MILTIEGITPGGCQQAVVRAWLSCCSDCNPCEAQACV